MSWIKWQSRKNRLTLCALVTRTTSIIRIIPNTRFVPCVSHSLNFQQFMEYKLSTVSSISIVWVLEYLLHMNSHTANSVTVFFSFFYCWSFSSHHFHVWLFEFFHVKCVCVEKGGQIELAELVNLCVFIHLSIWYDFVWCEISTQKQRRRRRRHHQWRWWTNKKKKRERQQQQRN